MGLLGIGVLFLAFYALCMVIGGLILLAALGALIDILRLIWRFFEAIVNKIRAFLNRKFGRF